MVYKQHLRSGVFVFWPNFPIFAALNGGVASRISRELERWIHIRRGGLGFNRRIKS